MHAEFQAVGDRLRRRSEAGGEDRSSYPTRRAGRTPRTGPNAPQRGPRRPGVIAGPILALTLAAGALGPAGLSGCITNPVTGRTSVNVFSVQEDIQMGSAYFDEVKAEGPLVTSGPELTMVRRVMARLVAVSDDPGYEWEVVLIDNPETVNAFALPGGKMAVYTGILPVTGTETGLAVVMGHEIGHVIAQHGTSRMTRELGFSVVLDWLGSEYGEDKAKLASAVKQYGVSLPFGRGDEMDADHTGLIYMARAGYDPREAAAFWQRMEDATGGGPPEWLSTHPSHGSRIGQMEELMPEAMEVWRASGGS